MEPETDAMAQHALAQRLQQALDTQVVWTPVVPPAPDGAGHLVTHTGTLHIPGLGPLPCYRLDTGVVVFRPEDVARLLGAQVHVDKEG